MLCIPSDRERPRPKTSNTIHSGVEPPHSKARTAHNLPKDRAVSSGPAIEVQQLTFRYAQARPALDAVSFVVQAGESVGLVGPNGAGKTSLFLCLAGVHPPSSGVVRVGGLD